MADAICKNCQGEIFHLTFPSTTDEGMTAQSMWMHHDERGWVVHCPITYAEPE